MDIFINKAEVHQNANLIVVTFENEENETMITISKDLASHETYFEYNDQSNGIYNAISSIYFDGNKCNIFLSSDGKMKLGMSCLKFEILCSKKEFEHILDACSLMFGHKFEVSQRIMNYCSKTVNDYNKIKFLNLDRKGLTTPPEDLDYYINLERLTILENPKLDIRATFEKLRNIKTLKQLHLTINGTIPEEICYLDSLEVLHIDGMPDLKTISPKIALLNKLKYLYLQSSSDIILLPQISDLATLEQLHVRADYWTLPRDFYKLSNLTALDLYNCDITDFPIEMKNMSSLTSLYLGSDERRNYETIFQVIGTLQNLKTLEINLSKLPENISLCGQIENLIIYSDYSIEDEFTIPGSFSELKKLKTLEFHRCNFLKFSDSLTKLASLQNISFVDCYIENIPNKISDLQNLESMTISNCSNFQSFPSSMAFMPSLKKLHLYNLPKLKSFPDEFNHLTHLEEIQITDADSIENIPSHWKSKINQPLYY